MAALECVCVRVCAFLTPQYWSSLKSWGGAAVGFPALLLISSRSSPPTEMSTSSYWMLLLSRILIISACWDFTWKTTAAVRIVLSPSVTTKNQSIHHSPSLLSATTNQALLVLTTLVEQRVERRPPCCWRFSQYNKYTKAVKQLTDCSNKPTMIFLLTAGIDCRHISRQIAASEKKQYFSRFYLAPGWWLIDLVKALLSLWATEEVGRGYLWKWPHLNAALTGNTHTLAQSCCPASVKSLNMKRGSELFHKDGKKKSRLSKKASLNHVKTQRDLYFNGKNRKDVLAMSK